jgi:hypothetical protein
MKEKANTYADVELERQLVKHIQIEDKKYAPHLIEKRVH